MGEAGGGLPGNCHRRLCMEVPVKPRRPPSLSLNCEVFPDHSSFSVLRETPMAFSCDYFKKLNYYHPLNRFDGLLCNLALLVGRYDEYLHPAGYAGVASRHSSPCRSRGPPSEGEWMTARTLVPPMTQGVYWTLVQLRQRATSAAQSISTGRGDGPN